jgi:predicted RNase H-like HicB family nuclease
MYRHTRTSPPPFLHVTNGFIARRQLLCGGRTAQRRLGATDPEQYSQATRAETTVIHMRYAIIIEPANDNFSAYVPDLPGCVATGATLEETEQAIREAIEFHIDGLREDGAPVPPPTSRVDYIEVAA